MLERLHLFRGFGANRSTAMTCFVLFVLTTVLFEISSAYIMRTSNNCSLVFMFKIAWSFLLVSQVLRVFFLSVFTKIIYKKFLFLFLFLSFFVLILNLSLTNGLIREGIAGGELKMSCYFGMKSFVISDFSKYALVELLLIVLLNVHTVIILIKYYRIIRSRSIIWVLIGFLFLFIVQVKLVIPFDFYIVYFGYLGFVCALIIAVIYESLKYVGLKDELKLQKVISETREETVHMIIHDFKVPLSILKNISENQSKDDILNSVRASASKMQYQIQDILDVYKQNYSALKISKEPCSLNSIVESAFENVIFFTKQKNITLIYKSAKEYIIDVDRSIIERVIINLLFNSVKYTSNGGLIKVELYELDLNLLEIRVVDNGTGIEAEKLNSVFNKFETYGNPVNSIHSSTGLGLSFCKVAVEAHGSSLELESVVSVGTSVSFKVDVIHADRLKRSFNSIELPESFSSIILTSSEKYYLSVYYVYLKRYSINEISDLRKIIKIIEKDEHINAIWLRCLDVSVNAFDKDSFIRLVEMINPQSFD